MLTIGKLYRLNFQDPNGVRFFKLKNPNDDPDDWRYIRFVEPNELVVLLKIERSSDIIFYQLLVGEEVVWICPSYCLWNNPVIDETICFIPLME